MSFVREWKIFAFTPEKHIAYAVQWFAMAFTLLLIFVLMHTRRPKEK